MIVPTYNEAENLPTLLDALGRALVGFDHEIIVVDDDSPDQTWRLAQSRSERDPRVRVVRRIGRRGLSSAVLEGMDAANGAVLAVLDADLQHDEKALPDICNKILTGQADICLGSRQAEGGSYGDFGRLRRLISFAGAQMARRLLGIAVTDPMSGYFALSRERFDQTRHKINPRGFKILLDLLAQGPAPRVSEVGYRFRSRRQGETKLTGAVMVHYVLAILALAVGRLRAQRFVSYVAVAVTALSLRLTVSSMFTAFGLDQTGLWLLAVEIGVLGEFYGHHHYTFARTLPPGRVPTLTRLSRLIRFHFVAANTVLTQIGLGVVVESQLTRPLFGYRLLPVFASATLGMIAALAAGYHLNRLLTWPVSSGEESPRRQVPLSH